MDENARKLAALELLSPLGDAEARYVWEEEVEGEAVKLEDIPPEHIEGADAPVTFFTTFNTDIPARVRDDFGGHLANMREAGELAVDGEVMRTVSYSPAPAKALQVLAAGGGFKDGLWPMKGADGQRRAYRLPPDDNAKAKEINKLPFRAIHMLLAQAMEVLYGANPLPAMIDDAGNAPTSAGES